MGRRGKSGPSGNVHGVLVVDKPAGMTSHDVVSRARRVFGTRRVGHAGTLDPMATGVLLLLFGEATKLSSVLTTEHKRYRTRVQFGVATDSLDADGRVTARRPLAAALSSAALDAALTEERTRRSQIPPQVSAIKVAGKRAYELARRGEETHFEPRVVSVEELKLLERGEDWVELELEVSKGYYVRSLARDLAERLGTVGHLTNLRRIQSGLFTDAEATPLPEDDALQLLTLSQVAMRCLPWFGVTPEGREKLRQGKRLSAEETDRPLVVPAGSRLGRAASAELVGPIAALHFGREGSEAGLDIAELVALVAPAEPGSFRVLRGVGSVATPPRPV